jgi:hypothetical protein
LTDFSPIVESISIFDKQKNWLLALRLPECRQALSLSLKNADRTSDPGK